MEGGGLPFSTPIRELASSKNGDNWLRALTFQLLVNSGGRYYRGPGRNPIRKLFLFLSGPALALVFPFPKRHPNRVTRWLSPTDERREDVHRPTTELPESLHVYVILPGHLCNPVNLSILPVRPTFFILPEWVNLWISEITILKQK